MPTGPGSGIKKYTTRDLMTKLMHSATTSNYFLSINVPRVVTSHITKTKGISITSNLRERINIACTSATLPGSSFATHDVTSDYMGVTEKMAYRRMYDDQMAVEMLVDSEYKTLHFFEGWMDYISGKNTLDREGDYKNYINGFRMNYPDGDGGYREKNLIELYKFERDTSVSQSIKYTLVEGFPISMNAMQLNYGGTEVLRLTVNFTFVRYVTEPYTPSSTISSSNKSSATVPNNTSVKIPVEPFQIQSNTGFLLNQNLFNEFDQFSLPSQNNA